METIERIKKDAVDFCSDYFSMHSDPNEIVKEFFKHGAISERNKTIEEAIEIIRQNRSLESAEYEWIKDRLERLKINLKG